MKIKLTRLTAFKRGDYWQVVLIPTISLFRSVDRESRYWAMSAEFLFWSIGLIIYNDDERTIHILENN